MVAKKKLNASMHQPREAAAPNCPTHRSAMTFDSAAMVWRCQMVTVVGQGDMKPCTKIAYPQADMARNRPHVFKGTIELIGVPDDDKYFLRLPDQNVLIDVTDYVDPDALVTMHTYGVEHYATITLRITEVVNIKNGSETRLGFSKT